ncbi:cyclic dehypoxanthinyl futalosine synthase [Granulicella aggregans]|uniref:Cyclic dehypoxanthinyl futalosine synthase n=1 Tax=Granulicella aggregans TaxID=474949 RepID=A0A7W8E1K5_9BACT|nr:dehypoxanthine futalosine cyclase [Granulicella aggregans]MBB5055938.1 cyclic dehypoxanthinyl futalosine synthase [Granulicella aggregans]
MGISQQQALDCFRSDDLIGIGMEADAIRRGLHPDGIVTYVVDRSFQFGSTAEHLLDVVGSAVDGGVAAIRLTGDAPSLEDMESVLTALRARFPSLRMQALTSKDVMVMAQESGVPEDQILARLRAAGLDAIEGGRLGVSPERWLAVHAAAHRVGLHSRAELTFGGDTTAEELVEQLLALRALQEETAGFTGLSLSGYKPDSERAEFEQPTAVEYLRTLAIARMVLDNFENIESSGIDQGLKVMQMAFRFGANDGGAVPPTNSDRAGFTEADLRRVIRDAGFAPVERDALYQTFYLNN